MLKRPGRPQTDQPKSCDSRSSFAKCGEHHRDELPPPVRPAGAEPAGPTSCGGKTQGLQAQTVSCVPAVYAKKASQGKDLNVESVE